MFDKFWKNALFTIIFGMLGGFIVICIFVILHNRITDVGSWADWFGAIGTIGAVWIAVSYRRTKIKYGVDATIIASAVQSYGGERVVSKTRFELDIFNINDPDLLIKDIEVEYDGTVISNFLEAEPIVIRGFEAKRIDTDRVKEWVSDMSTFKSLSEQNPKVVVVLAGNKRRKFKINFTNIDGVE